MLLLDLPIERSRIDYVSALAPWLAPPGQSGKTMAAAARFPRRSEPREPIWNGATGLRAR
jgi:hypothetical protein